MIIMEILLKFWPIAAALGWLLLVWIGVGFYVCRKYTGTWNGLRYIFDYKYWCYSILNHWYTLPKPYTSKRHNQVCKRWEEYSMRFSDDR